MSSVLHAPCCRSIAADVTFVDAVVAAYSAGTPVFANQRCGSWYTPAAAPSSQCYFKSTDGHVGAWTFSPTRLNLQVAAAAGRAGRAVIIDATRSGKRFPDALARTVPIWAAIVNALVFDGGAAAPPADATVPPVSGGAPAAGAAASPAEASSAAATAVAHGGAAAASPVLPVDDPAASSTRRPAAPSVVAAPLRVRFPPWIPASEVAHVKALLPRLMAGIPSGVKAAIRATLAGVLRAPLVPVWVCPDNADDILLASHEESTSATEGDGGVGGCAATAPAAVPGATSTPLILISASASPAAHAHGDAAGMLDASRDAAHGGVDGWAVAVDGDHGWTYVPGAGDDSENWALGLTPRMWMEAGNRRRLLACESEEECLAVVHELVRSADAAAAAAAFAGAGSSLAAAVSWPSSQEEQLAVAESLCAGATVVGPGVTTTTTTERHGAVLVNASAVVDASRCVLPLHAVDDDGAGASTAAATLCVVVRRLQPGRAAAVGRAVCAYRDRTPCAGDAGAAAASAAAARVESSSRGCDAAAGGSTHAGVWRQWRATAHAVGGALADDGDPPLLYAASAGVLVIHVPTCKPALTKARGYLARVAVPVLRTACDGHGRVVICAGETDATEAVVAMAAAAAWHLRVQADAAGRDGSRDTFRECLALCHAHVGGAMPSRTLQSQVIEAFTTAREW